MAEPGSARDIVLAPNEQVFVQDETKGQVNTLVGPYKMSPSQQDRPVVFDASKSRFREAQVEQAISATPFAAEGDYIVLSNPAAQNQKEHPQAGTTNSSVDLDHGRRINLPGPIRFPLWPGQVANVISGHHLRLNQYVIARVYNDEEARRNWGNAVIKPQLSDPSTDENPPKGKTKETQAPNLTMGQLLIIKGVDVSFYIPPTGVEVLKDENDDYVRNAVTLERLEYCILLNEDGNKRYVEGPSVVFPEPTETFVDRAIGNERQRKFRAIELNENSGIYVKVIADYQEGDQPYKVGEELFITGAEQAIYFPRSEHAIIKYGDEQVHYAIAIPPGEGRYVLNRRTGVIDTVIGPRMFLADPREQVVVRRILSSKTVELLYPGNAEALDYNQSLASANESVSDYLEEARLTTNFAGTRIASALYSQPISSAMAASRGMTPEYGIVGDIAGDAMTRKQKYTPPRTITLDSKYDGAVGINVWTGYAVLVVKKTGERRVVVGPQTTLLDYDENLAVLELSTGKPKTTDNLYRTVYLGVSNNKVSDIISAETNDLCKVDIKVSYRVNFVGDDQEKWFAVENYVKFLCDHTRSLVRNAVKKVGVEEFHKSATDLVRNVVLGEKPSGASRTGRLFPENNMQIDDVEVLSVGIGDANINELLRKAQHDAVAETLNINSQERALEITKRSEEISRSMAEERNKTKLDKLALELAEKSKALEVAMAEIVGGAQQEEEKLQRRLSQQEALNQLTDADISRQKAQEDYRQAVAKQVQDLKIEDLQAEVAALKERAAALGPDIVAALTTFGDQHLTLKAAEAMAPLAILGGKSVSDVLKGLLKDTKLEHIAEALAKPPQEPVHRG